MPNLKTKLSIEFQGISQNSYRNFKLNGGTISTTFLWTGNKLKEVKQQPS